MNIDYEKLREDLINYFGAGMQYMSVLIMELSRVENATNEELVQIAVKNGFDLNQYMNHKKIII